MTLFNVKMDFTKNFLTLLYSLIRYGMFILFLIDNNDDDVFSIETGLELIEIIGPVC